MYAIFILDWSRLLTWFVASNSCLNSTSGMSETLSGIANTDVVQLFPALLEDPLPQLRVEPLREFIISIMSDVI